MSLAEQSDLGPSVAFDFVKAFGPIDRKLGKCNPDTTPNRCETSYSLNLQPLCRKCYHLSEIELELRQAN